MNNKIKQFQYLIIVSLLFLSVFAFLTHKIYLSIGVASYTLILCQARVRFSFHKNISLALRTFFYFIPLLFFGWPETRESISAIFVGMGVGVFFILIRFNELKTNLSKDFVSMFPAVSVSNKIWNILYVIKGAITQEYFYRAVLLSILVTSIGPFAIVISAVLFTAEHFFHYNSQSVFDWMDYILQFSLGIGLGVVFFLNSSLIGVICGHIIYNSPAVVHWLRREIST